MQRIFRGREAELAILDQKFRQKGFIMTDYVLKKADKCTLIDLDDMY